MKIWQPPKAARPAHPEPARQSPSDGSSPRGDSTHQHPLASSAPAQPCELPRRGRGRPRRTEPQPPPADNARAVSHDAPVQPDGNGYEQPLRRTAVNRAAALPNQIRDSVDRARSTQQQHDQRQNPVTRAPSPAQQPGGNNDLPTPRRVVYPPTESITSDLVQPYNAVGAATAVITERVAVPASTQTAYNHSTIQPSDNGWAPEPHDSDDEADNHLGRSAYYVHTGYRASTRGSNDPRKSNWAARAVTPAHDSTSPAALAQDESTSPWGQGKQPDVSAWTAVTYYTDGPQPSNTYHAATRSRAPPTRPDFRRNRPNEPRAWQPQAV